MQTKTIKSIIIKKLEEWLETIDDKKLSNKVKGSLLVSGGSIASMLLREQVNDYDIYIQDMDILKDLAEYYCEGKVLDGRIRQSYLDDKFGFVNSDGTYETEDGEIEKYLSEEYIRIDNLKPNQIKLNLPGAGSRKEVKEKHRDKYLPVFFSQNAISLSNDIQIVLRFSGTKKQIHKTFDFVHAKNYFTFEDGLVLNRKSLESLITKNLKYQGSLYPLTSIIRMKKFINRGWSINAGEILKIMFQISELDLKDIKVLEEQLIGVDVAYFSDLIELLRGENSSGISSSFLSKAIDKVFNSYKEKV